MTYKEERDYLMNILGTIVDLNGGEMILSMGEYNEYKRKAQRTKMTLTVRTALDKNVILLSQNGKPDTV